MMMFVDVGEIYLHREFVDFRKSINGMVAIDEQEMSYHRLRKPCLCSVIKVVIK